MELESWLCEKVDSREICSQLGLWFSLLLLDSRIVDEKGLLCVLFNATCSRKDFCAKNGALTIGDFSLWALDSKIVELESWLFKLRKEDKTSGLSTKCGDEIHDSSPQAESLFNPPP